MRLLIQDHTGHRTVTEEDPAKLRAQFDQIVKDGYMPTIGDLATAEQVKSVDEAEAKGAKEILFIAPMVGG